MCTGKPQDSCDSLYGDICFIVAVWNSTHNVFKVSLYKKISHKPEQKDYNRFFTDDSKISLQRKHKEYVSEDEEL